MAYDEDLADHIRELLGGEADLTEQSMFGGLAFLVGGNMAVAASGQGGLLVRADPAEADRLLATTPARPMEMRGRPMRGGCAWTAAMSAPGASSHRGSGGERRTPGRSRPSGGSRAPQSRHSVRSLSCSKARSPGGSV